MNNSSWLMPMKRCTGRKKRASEARIEAARASAPVADPVRIQPDVDALHQLATRNVDDRDLVRARQREVAAAPVGREHDALRALADAHVRHRLARLRVDHREL